MSVDRFDPAKPRFDFRAGRSDGETRRNREDGSMEVYRIGRGWVDVATEEDEAANKEREARDAKD